MVGRGWWGAFREAGAGNAWGWARAGGSRGRGYARRADTLAGALGTGTSRAGSEGGSRGIHARGYWARGLVGLRGGILTLVSILLAGFLPN